jgi:RNA polymerase sigma-70 factor, ECF subfamily
VSAGEQAARAILPNSDARAPDVESLEWLRSLSGSGPERDDALRRLHALLLRAARAELARRRPGARGGAGELDDLVVQAADDALAAVLHKLITYRGGSRFTTWAYKFVLRETAVALRRREWHGRELRSRTRAGRDWPTRVRRRLLARSRPPN